MLRISSSLSILRNCTTLICIFYIYFSFSETGICKTYFIFSDNKSIFLQDSIPVISYLQNLLSYNFGSLLLFISWCIQGPVLFPPDQSHTFKNVSHGSLARSSLICRDAARLRKWWERKRKPQNSRWKIWDTF